MSIVLRIYLYLFNTYVFRVYLMFCFSCNPTDCQVLGCRLSLILDDLLWVLTDSQILGALHFMSSLSGLVKQATEMTQRFKAKRKLEVLFYVLFSYCQSTYIHFHSCSCNPGETELCAFTCFHFKCLKQKNAISGLFHKKKSFVFNPFHVSRVRKTETRLLEITSTRLRSLPGLM